MELSAAERAARRLVELEPFRESGHRVLMRALAERGNVADALRAYERLTALLRSELGVDPGPQTRDLHRELLRLAY
jgi:DNA-binding SARP family transcriptional activator